MTTPESSPQTSTSQQIVNQLAEGRRLLELEIHNSKQLQRAAARRSSWVENNVKLLKDSSLSEITKSRFLSQLELDSTDTGVDFDTKFQSFRDITKSQMSVLESFLTQTAKLTGQEHSPSEDKQRPIAGQSSQSSLLLSGSSTKEQRLSLRQRLESHPIGVAAVICAGCISMVVIIMSWYHGENEKVLINKYETQLNGMKIELDAQRRQSEEAIRKLKEELTEAKSSDKSLGKKQAEH